MSSLSDCQFKRIATIARDRWGLDFSERKTAMVSNRLAKFLHGSPFGTVESYLEHLEKLPSEENMLAFFDLLSTNVTGFFRERQHFDYLERELYTGLARGMVTTPGKRLRIWSAACSSGPEPYSLVMHALEHLKDVDTWDFKVLATDLAASALQTARHAVYPQKMVEELPMEMKRRYFKRGAGSNRGMVKVADIVRSYVTIRQLNLMGPWPMKGPFDVIFCRNVMIYFDRPTRERLVNRMCELLRPGGILAIGSAETLTGLNTRFRPVQASVYVR